MVFYCFRYSLIEHFKEVTSGTQAKAQPQAGAPGVALAEEPAHGAQSPLNNSDLDYGFGSPGAEAEDSS